MEEYLAAMPPTIVGIDGISSLSGPTNERDDDLPNEENTLESDIENEVPIEERIFTRNVMNYLDSNERTTAQDSSRVPRSPHRRRTKESDTPQRTDVLAIEETIDTFVREPQNKSPKRRDRNDHKDRDSTSPRRGGAVSPKPKSRTPKTLSKIPITKDGRLPKMLSLDDDDYDMLLSYPSIGISPPEQSFPNETKVANHKESEELCASRMESRSRSMENSEEESAVSMHKVASEVINDESLEIPRSSSVNVKGKDDLDYSTKKADLSEEMESLQSNSIQFTNARSIVVLESTADRYRTPGRRPRDKSVRRRRSNSLPPQDSRAAVVMPVLAQTPLRRSQRKKVDIALAIPRSPEKPPRRIKTMASDTNDSNCSQPLEGGIIKSPKRDTRHKECSCDPSSKSPRRISEESGSTSPKRTPLRSRRRRGEEKAQNEKWPFMLPMDEDDFGENSLKIPRRGDKEQDHSIFPANDSFTLEEQPQTSSLTLPLKMDEANSTGHKADLGSTKLLARENDIECEVGNDVEKEVDILTLSVDSSCEANLLQMSAVAASMDEGMAKVWARFDDQMHRSIRREALFDKDSGGDQCLMVSDDVDGIDQTIAILSDSPSLETEENKRIDPTIVHPIDSSADLDEPEGKASTVLGDSAVSEAKERHGGNGQVNVNPCDPPSSEIHRAETSEDDCDPSSLQPSGIEAQRPLSPVLYAIDDSRLAALQKVLVVDLWSDDSENVMTALNKLHGLDMKATTELLQQGGHLALILLLRKWRMSASIQTLIFGIVRTAAEYLTEFADAIVDLGALELILCSMKHFVDDEELVSVACGALLNLTLPAKHAKVFVFELNGIQTVTSACARFPANVSLQKYTLWMIQYFSYWDDFKAPIVQAGGMQALAKMIEAFSHRSEDGAAMETILKSARATMKRLL